MIKVNKNIVWADLFVSNLFNLGVRDVCISPGSRSTPLTIAFAKNKKIKKHVIVDERSSAFFALGIAKETSKPVAIVTTSGTAAAELYPAIVEAYQSRIPLLICTADRPKYLRNTGANQTINQKNLFKNHIKYFFDTGLPELNQSSITDFLNNVELAFNIANIIDRGPVHINFPFEKPLETSIYADNVSKEKLNQFYKNITIKNTLRSELKYDKSDLNYLSELLLKSRRGIIVVGPNNYESKKLKSILRLSNTFGFPIFADGASQLRANLNSKNLVVANYDVLLKSDTFQKLVEPELILQFGRTPTSVSLESFFKNISTPRILINEFGDRFDPLRKAKKIIKADIAELLKDVIKTTSRTRIDSNREWFQLFQKFDDLCEWIKIETVNNSNQINEANFINILQSGLPDNSNLFVSNSTLIRDLDFFLSKTDKKINIHQNRGASGIDGIISSALGIASKSSIRTFLVCGDLSFYYDLNSLAVAKKYSIPLTIILINNNGGGLFNFLPVSEEKKYFNEFFITPQNLDFEKIVKAFGLNHKKVQTSNQFKKVMENFNGSTNVIEIQTDSKKSLAIRKKYWSSVIKTIESNLKSS